MSSLRRITATPHINAITELVSYYEPLYITNDRYNMVTECCCSLETAGNFTDVRQAIFIKREVCEAISKSIQERSVVLNIMRFDNISTKSLINPYKVMKEIQNNFNYKTWSFGSDRKAHGSCRCTVKTTMNDKKKSSEGTKLCRQCFPRSKNKKSRIARFSSRNLPAISQSVGLGQFIQFFKKLFRKHELHEQSGVMQSFLDGSGISGVTIAKPVLQPSKEHYRKTPSERLRITRREKNEKEKNEKDKNRAAFPNECLTETLCHSSTKSNAILEKKNLVDIPFEDALKLQCIEKHIANQGNTDNSCIKIGKAVNTQEKEIEQTMCIEMNKHISEDKNLHEGKINNTQEVRIQQIRYNVKKGDIFFPAEMAYLKKIKTDNIQENRIGLQISDEKNKDHHETEISYSNENKVCNNLQNRKEQVRYIDIKNNVSEAELSFLKENKKVNIQGDRKNQNKCLELGKGISETEMPCFNKNIDNTLQQQKEEIRCIDVHNKISEPKISLLNKNKSCNIQEERINQVRITEIQNDFSPAEISILRKDKINTIQENRIPFLNKNGSDSKTSFVNEAELIKVQENDIKQTRCVELEKVISPSETSILNKDHIVGIPRNTTEQKSIDLNRNDCDTKMSFLSEKVVNIHNRIMQTKCVDVKQDISSNETPCIKKRKLNDTQEDNIWQRYIEGNKDISETSNCLFNNNNINNNENSIVKSGQIEIGRVVSQTKCVELNKYLSDASMTYQKDPNHNQKNSSEQEKSIEMNKKAFSEANISDFNKISAISTQATRILHKNSIAKPCIEINPNSRKIPCINMANYEAINEDSSKNILDGKNLENSMGKNTQNDRQYPDEESFDKKLLKLENICKNTKKFYQALKDLKMYAVSTDKCAPKCIKKKCPKKDGCKPQEKEFVSPCKKLEQTTCSFKKKPIKCKPCNSLTPNKEFKTYIDETVMPKKYTCGGGAIEKKVREVRRNPPRMMTMTEDEARSRFGKP